MHPSSLVASGGFSRPWATISNGPYVLEAFCRAPAFTSSAMRLLGGQRRIRRGPLRVRSGRERRISPVFPFRAGELNLTNTGSGTAISGIAVCAEFRLASIGRRWQLSISPSHHQGPLRDSAASRGPVSSDRSRSDYGIITRAGQIPAYALVPDDAWNYTRPSTRGKRAQASQADRARALYSQAGYSQAPFATASSLQRKRARSEVCHCHRRNVEGNARRRDRVDADGFKAYLARALDPAQWDVVRSAGRGLQRCVHFPRHDESRQRRRTSGAGEIGIRRIARISRE